MVAWEVFSIRAFILLFLFYKRICEGKHKSYVLSQEFSTVIHETGTRSILEYCLSVLAEDEDIETTEPMDYGPNDKIDYLDLHVRITTSGSVKFDMQATLDELSQLKDGRIVIFTTFVQKIEQKRDTCYILKLIVELLLASPSLIVTVIKNIWKI